MKAEMKDQALAPASGDLREKVARAIAEALGDDLDHAFVNKSEWNAARGEKGGRYRDINEPMREEYLAAAHDALNLIGGDGWKLVPVEPTEDMLKAPDDSGVGLYSREVFADIYRAMIAASPPPPVTP